jgi:DNA-binding FadR family transcriptional regulator
MLPSEKQLSEQFNVGRRAIREALRVLEMKGLVEVQVGVGTVVRRNDLDSFLEALTRNVRSYLNINRADIRHVMELRWILEGAALDELLDNPDAQRLQRLAEIITMQQRAYKNHDAKAYQKWHFCFHREIVRSLNNPVVAMIYGQVLALVRGPMERAGTHREVEVRAIKDHQGMLKALQRGARDDLRAILNRHLENFITDLDLPAMDQADGETT